jgi:hypothetical protein
MFMSTILNGIFFTVSAGIKYAYMKTLKANGIMFKFSEWIIRKEIYATDFNFVQKVKNSAPVHCEVHSIRRGRPLHDVL